MKKKQKKKSTIIKKWWKLYSSWKLYFLVFFFGYSLFVSLFSLRATESEEE